VSDKSGNALQDWWKIIRGKDGRVLRAEFGPPENSLLTLDDVQVGSVPLTSGGQLAELITMVIYARGVNMGVPEPTSRACVNRCCIEKGKAPDKNFLKQVVINKPCYDPKRDREDDPCKNDGCDDAFPELGGPKPLSPFDRRLVGRTRKE
jgi:hypothetical protein